MASAPVAGIDHVALIVRDIDEALPFYTEQLGFRLISDELTTASGGARLAYLDAGNIILQLVSPTGASGPIRDALDANGEGLHHICLTVDDIDQTLDRLAPGVETPIAVGGRGRRTAFLPIRPNGLVTELTEATPYEQ
ncbi:MAG: VOC family protein [Thermomicrobiales bacterium]|nr:VOC family protein [Thermomicrobiales bacterium]